MTKLKNDFRKVHSGVKRLKFRLNRWEKDRYDAWDYVPMINDKKATGFAMDVIPFGKGRERLAYRFKEMDANGNMIGKILVGKETKNLLFFLCFNSLLG